MKTLGMLLLLVVWAAPAQAQYTARNNDIVTLTWTYPADQLPQVVRFAVQFSLTSTGKQWKSIGLTDPTSSTPMEMRVKIAFPKGSNYLYFRVVAADFDGQAGEPSGTISFRKS